MEPASEAVVVNAAGFTAGAPVSPLSPAAAFGNFTGSTTASSSGFPLNRKLGETEVFIGNDAVPLFYASPTQVNFQVPGGMAPGQNVLEVRVGGQRVARGTIMTLAHAPGLFAVTDQAGRIGRGQRGGFITIYGAGQGAVTPAVADGAPRDGQSALAQHRRAGPYLSTGEESLWRSAGWRRAWPASGKSTRKFPRTCHPEPIRN